MTREIDNPTEKLDLVDANDQVIGAIARAEVLALEQNSRGFVRAIFVFLINQRGELWIPTRTLDKKVAPGGLDASTGEHVGVGETYQDAAIRGLHEELNIQTSANKLEPVGLVPPFASMPYFHKVYLYPYDETPAYNKEDFSSFEWLTPQQAADKLEHGAPAKETLLPAIKLIMEKRS